MDANPGTKFRDEEEGFCNQQPFLTCLLQVYVHITGLQQADMMNNRLVDVQVAVQEVAFVTNEIYKALSSKVSTKNSLNNEKHNEDEKAVRRFAKDLHALVDEYLEDFSFVSWTALPIAAMPDEDDPAQES